MRVVVAGGHGKIGLRLLRLLAADGHDAVGMVRNRDHAGDLHEAGASALVIDLEHATVPEVAAAVDGADVVVFAAGSGPGSGAARKLTMDRDGAVRLADAAVSAGVRRYLMVSSVNAVEPGPDDDLHAEEDLSDDEVFALYLRAKGAADAALRERDLDWVVVRPGRLTDEPGTGTVTLVASVSPRVGEPRRRRGRAARAGPEPGRAGHGRAGRGLDADRRGRGRSGVTRLRTRPTARAV